jgi:hypothetical protein
MIDPLQKAKTALRRANDVLVLHTWTSFEVIRQTVLDARKAWWSAVESKTLSPETSLQLNLSVQSMDIKARALGI